MLIGSGEQGQLTFLDLITIISFIIGVQNLDINITQTDLQEETNRLDAKVDSKVQYALNEIHKHLEVQDGKIEEIIRRLNENH